MYSIKLAWKEFNVDLQAVEAWVTANASTYYLGNSADTQLTLWFSQAPTEEQDINDFWTALTEESDEAVSYVDSATIKATIATLRAGLVAKEWDVMSVAERKIATNQAPTRAELGL